jgi:type I restriction enzyme R subunit
MEALITQVIAWPTLLAALMIFGFAPGATLRMIILAFRRDDPRRTELIAELPHVPRIERPFWVCEQLEVALFEGLIGRASTLARKLRKRRPRRKLDRAHMHRAARQSLRETGLHPFRQAIDENSLPDVLAGYLTYDAMWRLRNAAVEQAGPENADREADGRRTEAKLVRFPELHPTSLDQRGRLIVEDFRDNLAGRLGGRAKAMVVTTGRQHAFELYQSIWRWDLDLPGCGFGVLVAFAGSLEDKHSGLDYTEPDVNGFPERQLPVRFGYVKLDDHSAATLQQDEYRILVVVDKYQTGFDQPLLCGMYIDKPLAGAAAVQALSRLQRIHPLKFTDDVRVLDFCNTAADINAAFAPWSQTAMIEPTNPNLLYDKSNYVMAYGLLTASEMEAYIWILDNAGPEPLPAVAEQVLQAHLQPALDRFDALEADDERKEFRAALRDFVCLYSLLSQIVLQGDRDLERLYRYGRALLRQLPSRPAVLSEQAASRRQRTTETRA